MAWIIRIGPRDDNEAITREREERVSTKAEAIRRVNELTDESTLAYAVKAGSDLE